MSGVRLDDLSGVDIHWKMLTTVRPKSKMEEEMFSRYFIISLVLFLLFKYEN
jgi:hypothetical protein